MSEVTDILANANRRLIEIQLHHDNRPGVGQVAAFEKDVDRAIELIAAKLQNLAANGVDVASASDTLAGMAIAARAAGPHTPGVYL